ncbi:MAG: hypothetical protein U9R15_09610, partial [Chloroflexota bacterium]|nr:hypothetical protein [Chloroflexota bacterium]
GYVNRAAQPLNIKEEKEPDNKYSYQKTYPFHKRTLSISRYTTLLLVTPNDASFWRTSAILIN